MSIDGKEDTYQDRVFSESLCEAQDNSASGCVTLIFESGYKNEDMLETETEKGKH